MNNVFRILEGHWLTVAKEIPDNSVHCVTTSVPYYGLRSYKTPPQVWLYLPDDDFQNLPRAECFDGTEPHEWASINQYKDSWRRGERKAGFHSDNGSRTVQETKEGRWTTSDFCVNCNAWRGELGQEPDPEMYIDHLIQVCAEVHRILRPDGTLFVNIGDAYYNYRPGKNDDDDRPQGYNRERANGTARDIPSFTPKRGMKLEGYKEKDLMLIPWQFAIAMRKWGWWVRKDIIWSKTNCLSESVTDRPTTSHEPILYFTKSQDCFYDKWAITEPPTGNAHPRGRTIATTSAEGIEFQAFAQSAGQKPLSAESRHNDSFRAATVGTICPGGRNKRSVWTIGVQGYPGDEHYAAFPEEIPATCIKAGTSEVGCCRQCGAPWSRIVLKPEVKIHDDESLESRWRRAAADRGIDIDNATTGDSITLGWQRNCGHYEGAPVPCTVADPFGGRGTTGAVAVRLGRNAVICDLKPSYIKMIRKNLQSESPLWVKEVV